MNVNELIEKGYLTRISIDKKLISKELQEAEYDLDKAEVALEQKDFKWAIVKAYYSMFHASRAVLFSLGFKERRHFAVGMVLEQLNGDGKLESKYVNDFRAALASREDADYRYIYSPDTAIYVVDIAQEFLNRMKNMIE